MRKYLNVISTEFRNQLAYIPSFLLSNLFFVVIMLIFFTLWKVVYSSDQFSGVFTLTQMIWYLIFTESIELSKSKLYWDVEEEVKGGAIAYSLTRPYSYNLLQLSKSLGTSLVKLIPILLIGMVLGFILVGGLPGIAKVLPLGILVLVGGIIVSTLLYLIVSLQSFWVEDAFPVYLVLQKITFVFGGLFFPIEFLPEWLQEPAKVLPFTYCAYWPAKVIVDFDINSYLFVLHGQVIWIFILLGIASLIFKSAVRSLHVHGG